MNKKYPEIKYGDKFGKLTAISEAADIFIGQKQVRNKTWRCECECGNFKVVTVLDLRHGSVKSCGCLRRGRKIGSSNITKHKTLFMFTPEEFLSTLSKAQRVFLHYYLSNKFVGINNSVVDSIRDELKLNERFKI